MEGEATVYRIVVGAVRRVMGAQRSPKEQVEAEVARLRDLDLAALRLHWRRLMRRPAPGHIPRHLLIKILAYRLQANAFGDCDKATLRLLARLGQAEWGSRRSAGRGAGRGRACAQARCWCGSGPAPSSA